MLKREGRGFSKMLECAPIGVVRRRPVRLQRFITGGDRIIRGLAAWVSTPKRGGVRPSKPSRFQKKLGDAAPG